MKMIYALIPLLLIALILIVNIEPQGMPRENEEGIIIQCIPELLSYINDPLGHEIYATHPETKSMLTIRIDNEFDEYRVNDWEKINALVQRIMISYSLRRVPILPEGIKVLTADIGSAKDIFPDVYLADMSAQ